MNYYILVISHTILLQSHIIENIIEDFRTKIILYNIYYTC